MILESIYIKLLTAFDAYNPLVKVFVARASLCHTQIAIGTALVNTVMAISVAARAEPVCERHALWAAVDVL